MLQHEPKPHARTSELSTQTHHPACRTPPQGASIQMLTMLPKRTCPTSMDALVSFDEHTLIARS